MDSKHHLKSGLPSANNTKYRPLSSFYNNFTYLLSLIINKRFFVQFFVRNRLFYVSLSKKKKKKLSMNKLNKCIRLKFIKQEVMCQQKLDGIFFLWSCKIQGLGSIQQKRSEKIERSGSLLPLEGPQLLCNSLKRGRTLRNN